MSSFLRNVNWSAIYEEWMVLDNFRRFNRDNGLEKCPWCGRDFYEQMDPVVEEGGYIHEDFYESDPEKKHFHLDCWRERNLVASGHSISSLTDF